MLLCKNVKNRVGLPVEVFLRRRCDSKANWALILQRNNDFEVSDKILSY